MFENSGKKIKSLAKILCVLGVVGSFIAGIIIIAGGSILSRYGASGNLVLSGLMVITLGSLASFINALILYAFGDMAENVALIREDLARYAYIAPKKEE